MPNYQKSIIYKLCCKDTEIEEIYIGATTNFRRRKCEHKYCCYNTKKPVVYNSFKYQFIRDNGDWENWDMIQIKEISVNSKLELDAEERKVIEELKPSLNRLIPSRTLQEWYRDNKKKKCKYERDKYHKKIN